MLLVSHDRALLDAVAQRTAAIEDQTIRVYDGGWADLVRARAEQRDEAQDDEPPRPTERPRPAPATRAEPDRVAAVEAEIERKEREIAELETKLADDWTDTDDVAEHRRAREELQGLFARWETLLGRWPSPRPSSSARRRLPTSSSMTTTRVLLASSCSRRSACTSGPHRDRKGDEAALARIAGVIAGREVRISCPGTLAAITEIAAQDGTVALRLPTGRPADETKLSNDTCARLRALPARQDASSTACARRRTARARCEQTAIAVNVLSHEAWHLAGVREEAIAQCYALQTNATRRVRLGATPDDAEAVASFVLRDVQPALPSDYQSSRLPRRRPARPPSRPGELALGAAGATRRTWR